jgi:starch-binding outer membrane protein, SusD/RagB family
MKKYIILLLATMIGYSSCKQEDYYNPSSAGEEQVVTDINGLIAVANGLQYRYSIGRQSPVYSYIAASGLSTKELLVLNVGNTEEAALQAGYGTVSPTNSVISRLWENSNLTIASADKILNNLGRIGDAKVKNALICHANLFKGLSLLQLGTFWEQAPLIQGKDARFSPRADVLQAALKLFEDGAAAAGNFTADAKYVTTGNINFPNTFNVLIARTNLMLGKYDAALTAADKVKDFKSKSAFPFDDATRNPIFDVAYSNTNVIEPIDSTLGLPVDLRPNANDKRVLFYVKTKKKVAGTAYGKGFFTSNSAAIPIYVPGEVILIKAECYAGQNKLPEAVAELDKILMKKGADDAWGIGAELPAFAGDKSNKAAILNEIYRNRCIELFNSGLKLEDSRRFVRPDPNAGAGGTGAERSRNFYPYPQSERDNNTNTPADPAI